MLGSRALRVVGLGFRARQQGERVTKAIRRDPIYRSRRFPAEVIEQCVRWYVTYRLSYRDLVAMMAEQGIAVSHTTILRWVLWYVPEFEKRWARYARPVDASWRMDETAVSVRGGKRYLYRAVDRQGKSVDHLLCAYTSRGVAAGNQLGRQHGKSPRIAEARRGRPEMAGCRGA